MSVGVRDTKSRAHPISGGDGSRKARAPPASDANRNRQARAQPIIGTDRAQIASSAETRRVSFSARTEKLGRPQGVIGCKGGSEEKANSGRERNPHGRGKGIRKRRPWGAGPGAGPGATIAAAVSSTSSPLASQPSSFDSGRDDGGSSESCLLYTSPSPRD